MNIEKKITMASSEGVTVDQVNKTPVRNMLNSLDLRNLNIKDMISSNLDYYPALNKKYQESDITYKCFKKDHPLFEFKVIEEWSAVQYSIKMKGNEFSTRSFSLSLHSIRQAMNHQLTAHFSQHDIYIQFKHNLRWYLWNLQSYKQKDYLKKFSVLNEHAKGEGDYINLEALGEFLAMFLTINEGIYVDYAVDDTKTALKIDLSFCEKKLGSCLDKTSFVIDSSDPEFQRSLKLIMNNRPFNDGVKMWMMDLFVENLLNADKLLKDTKQEKGSVS